MKDGYRYCYRVVRGECSLRSLAHLCAFSLSADALCVVSLSCHSSCGVRDHLSFIHQTEPVIPIHYDTAHSTAHVNDTLGGSALSGTQTITLALTSMRFFMHPFLYGDVSTGHHVGPPYSFS